MQIVICCEGAVCRVQCTQTVPSAPPAPTGYITPPDYPNNYTNNENNTQTISVEPGTYVELVFLELQTEAGCRCSYDYVEIYDTDMTLLLR